MASFTILLLLPPATITQHFVTGRMRGPRTRSGRFDEETNLLSLPVFEPRSIGRPARSLVAVLNTLSRTVPFSALVVAAYNNNRFVAVEEQALAFRKYGCIRFCILSRNKLIVF